MCVLQAMIAAECCKCTISPCPLQFIIDRKAIWFSVSALFGYVRRIVECFRRKSLHAEKDDGNNPPGQADDNAQVDDAPPGLRHGTDQNNQDNDAGSHGN